MAIFPLLNFLRLEKIPQLPGAGRTRAGHHHGNNTPTSPRAIYVLKSVKCNEIMPSVYVVLRKKALFGHLANYAL